MPTYQYACTEAECGHAFEQFQNFTEDSLTVCPECDGRLRKVFNAVGVVFKGSGFYRTDSRSESGPGGKQGTEKTTAGSATEGAGAGSSSPDSGSTGSGSKDSGSKDSGSKGSGSKAFGVEGFGVERFGGVRFGFHGLRGCERARGCRCSLRTASTPAPAPLATRRRVRLRGLPVRRGSAGWSTPRSG